MGTVTALPYKLHRPWQLLEPQYREVLVKAGIGEALIQPMLEELKGYFLSITCQVNPSLELPTTLGLNQAQEQAIQAEFKRTNQETLRLCTGQIMAAMHVILRLIVQKHLSGCGEGPGEAS